MAESSTPTTPAAGAEDPVTRVSEVTATITVPVVNRAGAEVGTVDIDPAEFGGKISRQLLHDVVLMYLANQRAGTHHTLRRGEVAGSTKKLFRQKGTGNARVGTKRTNKRRGGGTAKGPKPRDYEYHLPKKAVRAATRMADPVASSATARRSSSTSWRWPRRRRRKSPALLKAIKVGKKTTEQGEKDVTLARHDGPDRDGQARPERVQVGPQHRGREGAARGRVQLLHRAEAEAAGADPGGARGAAGLRQADGRGGEVGAAPTRLETGDSV